MRYFNVFGKRQDPNGAYAAVIPKWAASMIKGEDVFINGDGETSRDFCFIQNAVQANILAATSKRSTEGQVFNVAVGDKTSLKTLFSLMRGTLLKNQITYTKQPEYNEFRSGDVLHSQADISKIVDVLNYQPVYNVEQGIQKAMPWYISNLGSKK